MTSTRAGVRAILLLPAIALVATLAACAPAAKPTPTSSPTHSAKPAAITSQPVAFGGDCTTVLSTSAVSTDVGTTMAPVNNAPWLDFSSWVVPAVGGAWCVWNPTSNTHAQSVDIIVLPATVTGSPAAETESCSADGSGDFGDCSFSVVYSGYWFSGDVSLDYKSTGAQAKAAIATIEGQLKTAAASAPKAPALVSITGAWAKPTSCSTLDASGALANSLGAPALTLEPDSVFAENGNPPGYAAAVAASNYVPCGWQATGSDRGFAVYFYPGGASSKPNLISAQSTPATVPGADAAYVSPGIEGTKNFDVFAGTNAFVISSSDQATTTAQFTAIATAALKDLGH